MNYCTDLYIQLMYATFHGQVKEFFEGNFFSRFCFNVDISTEFVTISILFLCFVLFCFAMRHVGF